MPTSESPVDLSVFTDDELDQLRRAVSKERSIRRQLDASPEKIGQVMHEYQRAHGVEDGDQWEPPSSPMMRPMEGARRTHDGRLWRSTMDHNIFEPGESGWVLEPEVDEETGKVIYPPFHRPSGAHDAYEKGQKITWEDGKVYAAVRDGVEWDPGNAPEEWELVEDEPEPEPEPDPEDPGEDEDDEPTEPDEPDEPDAEPGTIENPLTWSGDSVNYKTDQYVTYESDIYRVRSNHTSQAGWKPDQVPALYERQ